MPLAGAMLEIAQAMVTWLNGKSAVQALGTVVLDLSGVPHPRYPINPVADCPRLLLALNVAQNQLAISNGRESTYQISLWYYRRQTAGQEHRRLLAEAIQDIEQEFLTDARPTALQNYTLQLQTPYEIRYHDDMAHPLSDEPRLRVSVAEILLIIQSSARRTA